MATIKRRRIGKGKTNTFATGIGGSVGDTTLDFGSAHGMPALLTDEYDVWVAEPGTADEEVMYATAYPDADTATVVRGREGSAIVAHSATDVVRHQATTKDYDGLIASKVVNPVSISDLTAGSGGTFADFDAVNLSISFVVPPSGKVRVVLSAASYGSTTYPLWALREGSSEVAGTRCQAAADNTRSIGITRVVYVTGLTAGDVKTWKWAGGNATGGGNSTLRHGGDYGPAVMEVWAVNV